MKIDALEWPTMAAMLFWYNSTYLWGKRGKTAVQRQKTAVSRVGAETAVWFVG